MVYTVVDRFVTLLKHYQVDTVFGVVGIPIVTLANEIIKNDIKFISCRNEQSASYAASAYGYLNKKPGVLLVVGGPGLIHSLAGIYNSIGNKWPLLVIAGSNDNGSDQYKGAFQEMDQISLLSGHIKFEAKISGENIDDVVFKAYNYTIQGSQGVSYLDFPGNLIEGSHEFCPDENDTMISPVPQVIRSAPDNMTIRSVSNLLIHKSKEGKKILVVIGKGANSVDSAKAIKKFVNEFNFPFLPTPMGKGIIPDDHLLNVSGARSLALQESDIVLIFGARLNWILHYGAPQKWNPDALFIQCDNHPETLGFNNTRSAHWSLLGDIELIVKALFNEIKLQDSEFRYGAISSAIQMKINQNEVKLIESERMKIDKNNDNKDILNYNNVYSIIRNGLNLRRTFLISEGANTMDKARVSFPTYEPVSRLDAGTNATMGVGVGYAMAAKLTVGGKKDVVLIQGDSAFGFSGMELETVARFKLGIIIVIMNNSGIYHGNDVGSSTKLTERCRYDLVARGLGVDGYLVETFEDLKMTLTKAIKNSRIHHRTSLLNVIIEHGSGRKVSFAWQNKARL